MNKFLAIFLLFTSIVFGFDSNIVQAVVSGVANDSCKIYVGNLTSGQSGIIVHNYDTEHKTILAKAVVVSSSQNSSTIKIIYEDVLPQSALPSIKRKVQNGDILILNHLYSNMVIIAPNFKSYTTATKLFKNSHIINPDVLGAHLKITNTPVPTKKEFQNFLNTQNIGLIVFIVNNKAHIVDANSFKIIDTIEVNYDDKTTFSPFYTNIEEIQRSLYNFGDASVKQYHEYYSQLLKESNTVDSAKASSEAPRLNFLKNLFF